MSSTPISIRSFKRSDVETGYQTDTLLAVPLHSLDGAVIGVGEATNKLGGSFTAEDAKSSPRWRRDWLMYWKIPRSQRS